MGDTRAGPFHQEFCDWLDHVWVLSAGDPELSRGELRKMFDRDFTPRDAADYSLGIRAMRHFVNNVGKCGCDLCTEVKQWLGDKERLD